ncbi:MAG: hypothetical protein QOE44_2824 [Solirubrobacteraceae bacterium]|nr:hypothetical protein [Solirubrobacteraceae bacterium]
MIRPPGRPLGLGLAGVLGVGAALLVGCGGTNSHLIPGGSANQLKSDFDAVASAVAGGSCDQGLTDAVAQARRDLDALPSTLDPRLSSALHSGIGTLSYRAHTDCKSQTTTTTPTTPTSTAPTTPTTPTTSTNTAPTTPSTPTTQTTTTPTDTTPTDTTSTDTTPSTTSGTTNGPIPDNGGGTPAPNDQTGQIRPGGGATGGAGAAGGTSGQGGGN